MREDDISGSIPPRIKIRGILETVMTKNLNYLIKLTYDKAYRGYVADVVNLYGCMSQGKTKREALENAKKAIKAYMEVIQKSSRDKAVVEEIVNVPVSVASV